MTKFGSSDIKKNDCEYEVKDILVLNELNKRPTLVKDPLITFSGHSHTIELGSRFDFAKVVSNLQKKELIRENLPREILYHLTAPEMKVILKNISKPISGTRQVLINRIETYASDMDISKNTDKSYFVLTEIGLEIMNKYFNVVWIAKNKDYIFGTSLSYRSKFDEYYFMKYWNLDVFETMINYYESKDSGIVARLYQLKNNYEQVFYYGIRKLSEDINFQIEKCKKFGWFDSDVIIGDFQINCFRKIFNSLNISDDSLSDIIKYIYEFSIKDPSLITLDTFKKMIISALYKEDKLNDELSKDLSNSIRKKFGHELHDEIYSHQYVNDNESLHYILNALTTDEKHKENIILKLVDGLDLKMISQIKEKIDARLL